MILPILPPKLPFESACSVNHIFPSGPAVIPVGPEKGVMPAVNSVTTPSVVIRPILFAFTSVNQRFPSGPAVIYAGKAEGEMPAEYSTICGVTADAIELAARNSAMETP